MIRVGTAGWSYPDWEGTVYPRRKPKGFHALAYLARFFDCVEVNSSFYATPRAKTVERWAALVRDFPDFRFLVKLRSVFTHGRLPVFPDLEREAADFCDGIEPLVESGRLSAVLMQFPQSFRASADAVDRLRRLSRLFGHLPLAIELRHRSWFDPPDLAMFEALQASLVEIDLPAAPDHPPHELPRVGPIGYLRVHGRNADAWFDSRSGRDAQYDYLYDEREIADLVLRARRLATGREETFVITNNHYAGKAAANALEILAGLSGSAPRAPLELLQAYPRLRRAARVDGGQGILFEGLE